LGWAEPYEIKYQEFAVNQLRISVVVLAVSVLSNASGALAVQRTFAPDYDQPVPDFKLKDTEGKTHALSDYADRKAVVVAFTGLGCPLSNLYTPRIQSIADAFESKGVAFFVVNSNHQDSTEELAKARESFGLRVPLLKDERNSTADAFGVMRTNEVFVLDASRRIVYHGAIDDQYGIGYQRPKADNTYLRDALAQTLAGQSISTPRTQAFGCVVGRDLKADGKPADVTYHNQVARIFQQNCQSCHREGQIGPFVLDTYKDAKGWAGMIKEVVSERRMPPWHADPKHGEFINDRSMSQAEIDTVVAWVDAGAPEGDIADSPKPVEFSKTEWLIGEPDAIFELTEAYEVPAEGTVDYQYFRVKTNFDDDKWISAGEIRPGAPGVVHHVLTFVRPPGSYFGGRGGGDRHRRDRDGDGDGGRSRRFRGGDRDQGDRGRDGDDREARAGRDSKDGQEGEDRPRFGRRGDGESSTGRRLSGREGGSSGGLLPSGVGRFAGAGKKSARERATGGEGLGFFISNVPGQMPHIFPEGSAKLLPKGWDIVFQMHYTPNGKTATDRTKLGVRFTEKPPTFAVKTSAAGQPFLRIPPNDANHIVGAKFPVKEDMKILAFLPHMHVRGKAFKYEVSFPDGRTETVLDVPKYDFGWQVRYVLANPLMVPKGSEIFCRAVFDNSSDNPWNPDPSQEVRWGDQTWEEMMIGFFDYVDLEPIDQEAFEKEAKDDRKASAN
jgi:peroxiredoxin